MQTRDGQDQSMTIPIPIGSETLVERLRAPAGHVHRMMTDQALLLEAASRIEELEGERERDSIGSALVAGLDAHLANVYRHAPLGLSNEEARAWYRGYDTRTDVRPDPVPLAQTPLGIALTEAKASLQSLQRQLEEAREALRPFAAAGTHVPADVEDFKIVAYVPAGHNADAFRRMNTEMTARDFRLAASTLGRLEGEPNV